jgi:hypothetical protein
MRLQSNGLRPGILIDREALKASGFRNADIVVVDLNDPRLSWVGYLKVQAGGYRMGTCLRTPNNLSMGNDRDLREGVE